MQRLSTAALLVIDSRHQEDQSLHRETFTAIRYQLPVAIDYPRMNFTVGKTTPFFFVFFVKLFLSCKGFAPLQHLGTARNVLRSQISLQRHDTFMQSKWLNDVDDVKRNLILVFAIGSMTLSVPTPSFALEKNPEALELRRVMEQPAGAPEAVKKVAVKLPSGVTYFDYVDGDGAEVQEGKSVQFQWVLRRSNGYFVDASSNYGDEPFIYKVGNTKKVIKGVDEGIRGMKVGGVRRMNIPPKMAFVSGVGDDKPGPMPAGFGPRRQIETRIDKEVWYFEIKVTKVK